MLAETGDMPSASFFPEARLNFAENLLRKSGAGEAIVFRGEDRLEARLTWDELAGQVSRLQQFLLAEGVGPGDRIAAMMPNMPQTIVAMLAAASIGAVWSSCSPDFGEQGVLDRFGQIEPVILVVPDGYYYNGKVIDVAGKVGAIAARLPSLRRVLVADYLGRAAEVASAIGKATTFDAALARHPVRARRVHAPAVLPSAGHPVLLGNDRRPEMHRPLRRRHASAASQGAPAACRHRGGRPLLLFHDLRLDDVELAGLGAGVGRHPAALRRLAVLADRQRAVRLRARPRA